MVTERLLAQVNPPPQRHTSLYNLGQQKPVAASMRFRIVGEVSSIETIARGVGIRDRARLRKAYGHGRWRKLKGTATIQYANGTICVAELHWYEAHGIGRRNYKVKRVLRVL